MLDAVWTLEVENHTKGWSYSTHHGKTDTPQLSAADPIVLQSPFKGTWGLSDYPSGWLPRVAQLELRAFSAAAFESEAPCDPGDLVDVWLFHEYVHPNPAFGIVRNTWFRCVGYADEPEAAQDDRGLVVKVAVADPLARAAEIPVDDPNPWPSESLGARLSRIAAAAGINIVSMAIWENLATMGPVTVNNKGALPLLQECLSGVQTPTGEQLIVRGTVGEIEFPGLFAQTFYDAVKVGDAPAWSIDPVTLGTTGLDKQAFVIDVVSRQNTLEAPYVLTAAHDLGAPGAAAGVGLWVATRTPKADLWDLRIGAALSARDVLREGTSWVKSRAQSINQVKLVGVDAAGEEKSVVAQYSDLVVSDGPSTRVVQTQRLIDAGASTVAANLLPDRASARPAWTADQFTLTTRDMDADELVSYSRSMFPGEPDLGGVQVPVAIVGVDTTAALTGDDLSGMLQGSTVQIQRKGELEIVAQLRSEYPRPSGLKTQLLTYSHLRSEVVDNAPALTWASFDYHSDDAIPHQGSDHTFDADQAHPSFGHRQLSYRDFRLIGVQ